jgi:hypothetical protein
MLQECSCEATKQFIEELTQKGVALTTASNTPLQELVKNTTIKPVSDLTAELGEELQAIPVETMIEQSDNSMHNTLIDEVSERAAAIVNKRIDVIINGVLPAVRSLKESVEASLTNVSTPSTIPNIKKYSASDMIMVPSFMSEIDKNTPADYLSPDRYFKQEPMDAAGILKLLTGGSQAIKDAIAVTVNRIGDDNLFVIWDSLFVDRAKSTVEKYLTFDQVVLNPQKGLDQSILVFLLASALEKDDPETAREYKTAAAYWISKYADNYHRSIERNELIRNGRDTDGMVEVYLVPYMEFLKRGGTVEMVLGAVLNAKRYVTVDAILEHSEEVLRSYEVARSAESLEKATKIRQVLKDAVNEHFMRLFKHERTEFEVAYFEQHPSDESIVFEKLQTYLSTVSVFSLQDLQRCLAEMTANCRFFYVDCYDFLKMIDAGCSEGMTAQEALTSAVLREIAVFVTSMTRVE